MVDTLRIIQVLHGVFSIRESVNISRKEYALHISSEHFDFMCCWPVTNHAVLKLSERGGDIPAGRLPCVLSTRICLGAVGVQEMTWSFQSLLFIRSDAYL